MIKLTKWENTILLSYLLDSDEVKTFAIRDINSEDMPIPFKTKLLLTKAILDGDWEVEEQLYYVKNKKGASLLRKLNGKIVASQPFGRFFTDNKEEYQLTRREVASYDKRYLEFLEEVEE